MYRFFCIAVKWYIVQFTDTRYPSNPKAHIRYYDWGYRYNSHNGACRLLHEINFPPVYPCFNGTSILMEKPYVIMPCLFSIP